MGDDEAVLAANRTFYGAFEARDMDAMSDLWEHSDRAACVHPGWGSLAGWGAISASWFALFQNGENLQFIITNERVAVEGDVAWVSCDENILADEVGGTVAAMNVFVRHPDRWRLVVHHGSSVAERRR
ncbi:MAG TPA: nuclear transport factor 2 family protein [Acidimicrobiales bacterium]|nr:nuclear transport factor 2 family protein [Acidimicrobiales bacterium]